MENERIIAELKAQIDFLKRAGDALHIRANEEELRRLRAENKRLNESCQSLLRERAKSGAMINAALQGRRHPEEPENYGYLDAVRGLVAELEAVRKDLADEQEMCDKLWEKIGGLNGAPIP